MTDLTQYWPPDGIVLQTRRLRLTVIREADFPEAIDAILAGIHNPATMPFGIPWTDAAPAELVPNALRYWWSTRGAVAPDDWKLMFAIRHDGHFVGVQEVRARNFAVTRTVSSGSWLTRSAQGAGVGAEMRAAILLLAFDHLGAQWATTSAFVDNPASNAVSGKLGYRENGLSVQQRRPGERAAHQHYRVTPEQLNRPDWTLQVAGLPPCLQMLGATGQPE